MDTARTTLVVLLILESEQCMVQCESPCSQTHILMDMPRNLCRRQVLEIIRNLSARLRFISRDIGPGSNPYYILKEFCYTISRVSESYLEVSNFSFNLSY
jgi:hypothetical protein